MLEYTIRAGNLSKDKTYSPSVDGAVPVSGANSEVSMLMVPMISIVDDDSSVREATMDLLRAMGFTVEVFPCAEDFLASELRHNTSCLISDMRMPGMSGLELHNRLVEAGAPIPTILMTAFPNGRDKASALQAGVVGYLGKPFNETELLGFVHSVFGGS